MEESKRDPSQFFENTLYWERLEMRGSIPAARSSHTCTPIDGELLFFGGYGHDNEYDDFIQFKPVDDHFECTQIAPVERSDKTARIGHSAIPVARLIYVFGGWNGKKYLNYGFILDKDHSNILIEKATATTELPEARRDHSMVRIEKSLYLFGGWNSVESFNDIWMLNDVWKWSRIESISDIVPQPRRGHSAIAIGSKMFIFGGVFGYSTYLNELWSFDIETLEWSTVEMHGTIPVPRAWHSCVLIGSLMFIFGGSAGRLNFFNDLHILDTSNMTWYQPKIDPNTLPQKRCSHAMSILGTDLVFFGGIGPNEDNDILPYDDLYRLKTGLQIPPIDSADTLLSDNLEKPAPAKRLFPKKAE